MLCDKFFRKLTGYRGGDHLLEPIKNFPQVIEYLGQFIMQPGSFPIQLQLQLDNRHLPPTTVRTHLVDQRLTQGMVGCQATPVFTLGITTRLDHIIEYCQYK